MWNVPVDWINTLPDQTLWKAQMRKIIHLKMMAFLSTNILGSPVQECTEEPSLGDIWSTAWGYSGYHQRIWEELCISVYHDEGGAETDLCSMSICDFHLTYFWSIWKFHPRQYLTQKVLPLYYIKELAPFRKKKKKSLESPCRCFPGIWRMPLWSPYLYAVGLYLWWLSHSSSYVSI